ncbi:MAG: fumarylacetoacetate hydrolase family protein [Spirochaetes bacterium]|nr:fumarylacetoacetate hydrolase family protein [Spirochaetota bacterium]
MRIIRFLDNDNKIYFGTDYENDTAVRLEGDLFGELKQTGQKVMVKKLLAPLVPAAIFCIGLNYKEHAGETGFQLPDYPALFMKNPASVTNPGDPVVIPKVCLDKPEVDYEIELAVIIGKQAKDVPVSEALDYILGYTIANDVSARRWQKKAGGGQWVRGKSYDTFCPVGPAIATKDEIPDPQNLSLQCMLNDEVMQDSSTSNMIYSVAELISYLSQDTTLLPGTLVLTGTPDGVGYVRTPPVFLKKGDILKLKIEKLGMLSNPVL